MRYQFRHQFAIPLDKKLLGIYLNRVSTRATLFKIILVMDLISIMAIQPILRNLQQKGEYHKRKMMHRSSPPFYGECNIMQATKSQVGGARIHRKSFSALLKNLQLSPARFNDQFIDTKLLNSI